MKNLVLKIAGLISLGLGVIGAFLPLLPSTCFILLSTWLFSKSSPRFHHWLVCRSPFSESINNWQEHRVIPKKVKVMASLSIVVSFAMSAWLLSNPYVLTLFAAGMLVLLGYLLSRDSKPQPETSNLII